MGFEDISDRWEEFMDKTWLDDRVIEWLDIPDAKDESGPKLWVRLLKKLHSQELLDRFDPSVEDPIELLAVVSGHGSMLVEMLEKELEG